MQIENFLFPCPVQKFQGDLEMFFIYSYLPKQVCYVFNPSCSTMRESERKREWEKFITGLHFH